MENEMKEAFDYLKRHRGPENLFITEEYDRLQEQILGDTRKGDLVLLKGSRAMQMEAPCSSDTYHKVGTVCRVFLIPSF